MGSKATAKAQTIVEFKGLDQVTQVTRVVYEHERKIADEAAQAAGHMNRQHRASKSLKDELGAVHGRWLAVTGRIAVAAIAVNKLWNDAKDGARAYELSRRVDVQELRDEVEALTEGLRGGLDTTSIEAATLAMERLKLAGSDLEVIGAWTRLGADRRGEELADAMKRVTEAFESGEMASLRLGKEVKTVEQALAAMRLEVEKNDTAVASAADNLRRAGSIWANFWSDIDVGLAQAVYAFTTRNRDAWRQILADGGWDRVERELMVQAQLLREQQEELERADQGTGVFADRMAKLAGQIAEVDERLREYLLAKRDIAQADRRAAQLQAEWNLALDQMVRVFNSRDWQFGWQFFELSLMNVGVGYQFAAREARQFAEEQRRLLAQSAPAGAVAAAAMKAAGKQAVDRATRKGGERSPQEQIASMHAATKRGSDHGRSRGIQFAERADDRNDLDPTALFEGQQERMRQARTETAQVLGDIEAEWRMFSDRYSEIAGSIAGASSLLFRAMADGEGVRGRHRGDGPPRLGDLQAREVVHALEGGRHDGEGHRGVRRLSVRPGAMYLIAAAAYGGSGRVDVHGRRRGGGAGRGPQFGDFERQQRRPAEEKRQFVFQIGTYVAAKDSAAHIGGLVSTAERQRTYRPGGRRGL
ncbi:MAG: hypothetical protein M5U09_13555 [Gammaproteobacteria bacterium]|nr:hypothetical protein [Gammaproteobacteria bacterium]